MLRTIAQEILGTHNRAVVRKCAVRSAGLGRVAQSTATTRHRRLGTAAARSCSVDGNRAVALHATPKQSYDAQLEFIVTSK